MDRDLFAVAARAGISRVQRTVYSEAPGASETSAPALRGPAEWKRARGPSRWGQGPRRQQLSRGSCRRWSDLSGTSSLETVGDGAPRPSAGSRCRRTRGTVLSRSGRP
eukprot:1486626-Pyramimonas_sp.AAC.1